MSPLPLTGEQYEITAGEVHAVVTEVGAGLRTFTANGLPYVEPFPLDSRPPRGAGTVLVPWPNRTAGGRWSWQGTTYQLALNEPVPGNAIHGLLRYTFYEVVERATDTITLAARVAPQPGWPVPLATQVRYAVSADGLSVTHTVSNVGAAAVPFGVGAHPYIRAGDTATDDCTLQLAATTSLPLQGGLPSGPARPAEGDTDFRDGRPLKGVTLDDAFGGCVARRGRRARAPPAARAGRRRRGVGGARFRVGAGLHAERPPRPRPGGGRRADDLPAGRAELRHRPDHAGARRDLAGQLGAAPDLRPDPRPDPRPSEPATRPRGPSAAGPRCPRRRSTPA